MGRLRAKPIRMGYWRPLCDYETAVAVAVSRYIRDGDILVVSEKAISVAKGNIVDEALVKPGIAAKALARIWMRVFWGYILGPLCRLRPATIMRLRSYPIREGAAHKELVLRVAGPLHALKHGSEGGIDLSNVPYSYACLPLNNPQADAERLRRRIADLTGRIVTVLIADTDSTFSLQSFHFTSRPGAVRGIHAFPGPLPFIVGRALGLRQRATPLAVAGLPLSAEDALRASEAAHCARGSGAGRTVWDMADSFGVGLGEVTWEMLEKVEHFPIVIIRPKLIHRDRGSASKSGLLSLLRLRPSGRDPSSLPRQGYASKHVPM
jgi:F420-0:gamma-glutamyl ligase-like protein